MADRLIVRDLGKPLDGKYEFDMLDIISVGRPGSLTNREAHLIKVMSGIRAGEIIDGVVHSDNDLFVALAMVLLERAGKTVNEDRLWDAKLGCLQWDIDMFKANEAEEAEADPPEVPAVVPGSSTSGGKSSAPTSVSLASVQSSTGHPDSGKSATYDHPTLGS